MIIQYNAQKNKRKQKPIALYAMLVKPSDMDINTLKNIFICRNLLHHLRSTGRKAPCEKRRFDGVVSFSSTLNSLRLRQMVPQIYLECSGKTTGIAVS